MPPDQPRPPAEALTARLASWPDTIFVVIDGSRFPDIAAVLRFAGLSARSLFLEHRNPATVAAGPFLAKLTVPGLDALMRIGGIETACVFWGGALTEPEVFRHLRTINMAYIPRPPDAHPGPRAPIPTPGAMDAVLFRHWDPAVLPVMLPVLEPAQRARLFGPMARLTLFAPEPGTSSGLALQAVARTDWPAPARGWLQLSAAQMAGVEQAMALRSHRSIAAYLRDTAPDHTNHLDEAGLLATVVSSVAEARRWGITTEAGFGRFAWLMLATAGRFAHMAPARAYVLEGAGQPDRRLQYLMTAMSAELSAHGAPA